LNLIELDVLINFVAMFLNDARKLEGAA